MNAKRVISLAGVALVALMASTALGADATGQQGRDKGTKAAGKANPRKGKVFYKKNCRVCHDGSTEAKELSPISKTMKQWTREFVAKGTVPTGCVARTKDEVGTELTSQDLTDIQSYLVRHAADSDQPATCGN